MLTSNRRDADPAPTPSTSHPRTPPVDRPNCVTKSSAVTTTQTKQATYPYTINHLNSEVLRHNAPPPSALSWVRRPSVAPNFLRNRRRMPAHPCPYGIAAHAARHHRNTGIHAGRHAGHREGTQPARPGRRSRRPDSAGQHVSSLSAPRSRTDPPNGRTPPVHVLAQRHPYRFGRISGVQPERPAPDRRGWRWART